mgnify:CR=1 FL=1
MNPFQLTKGQAQDADRIFNYLLSQPNQTAYTAEIGLGAFLTKKNDDQVNELVQLILDNQPQELIRVIKRDYDWMVEATGLLLNFMQPGGMMWYWEGQMLRAQERAKQQAEKDRIEREALELDIELKKNIIEDYPKTKARATRNEYVAWISIIVAIAAMVFQLVLG